MKNKSYSEGSGRDELLGADRERSTQHKSRKQPMSSVKKIGCGCFIVMVLSIGACATFVGSIIWLLQQSDAFIVALEMAQEDLRVQQQLGVPIESGYIVEGNVSLNNNGGHAELEVPISGPLGSATVSIVGTKSEGVWIFTKITCTFHDSGAGTIDLREKRQ